MAVFEPCQRTRGELSASRSDTSGSGIHHPIAHERSSARDLLGTSGTARNASSSLEVVFVARRQNSMSQSIARLAVDGKALQREPFFLSHADKSTAQWVSLLPARTNGMPKRKKISEDVVNGKHAKFFFSKSACAHYHLVAVGPPDFSELMAT
jgi:hypothetical protein